MSDSSSDIEEPQERSPSFDFERKQDQGSFCSFIRSLGDSSDSTIKLFERDKGEYYTAHGQDAIYIANNVYKTTTILKYLGGDQLTGLPSCSMSRVQAESFMRDMLLTKQYRIEIWSNEVNGRAGSQWKCVRKGSPGNLSEFEDLLYQSADVSTTPVLLAVRVSSLDTKKTVGIAYCDVLTKRLGFAEFLDNDLFSNLESALIQLNVKECLLSDESQNADLTKIKTLLDRCSIVMTERKRSEFAAKDIDQDLQRLLKPDRRTLLSTALDAKLAMSSLSCCIRYLSLLADESQSEQFDMAPYDLSHYVKLDAAAMRAMNVFPAPKDGASNKTMSLFGLLNRCRTAQGTRLLQQWLSQPLMNVSLIRERQDLVQLFLSHTSLRLAVQDEHLKRMPDLTRLANKFRRARAHLQDAVRLYQALVRLPLLVNALQGELTIDEETRALLDRVLTAPMVHGMRETENLKELVESTIDLALADHHEYVIKPGFDESLQTLRNQMDAILDKIPQEFNRVANDLCLEAHKKIKLEKTPQFGYFFRVSRQDAGCLRNTTTQRRYIELATQKNGMYFTTPTLKTWSDEYHDLQRQYNAQQSVLVKEIVSIIATYSPILEQLNTALAALDVLTSFAEASLQAPTAYIRPQLLDREHGEIYFKEARHPCLEVQEHVTFIANDIHMTRDTARLALITGPNMGGKSTFIRTAAMLILLAQIGCFVPCSEARLSLCDSLLARVGAGDSQMKGVSTFMAEMLETASILSSATPYSFIIIDELGRGTSTYDGFGLAYAIAEHIATRIACFCLFATHFHELTALASSCTAVTNLHVTAHTTQESMTLLYKVLPGVCDRSFGIHVAELARFPAHVVRLAKRKAAEIEALARAGSDDSQQQPLEEGDLYAGLDQRTIEEGEALIKRYLTAFSVENIEDAPQAMERLRKQWEAECGGKENAFVQRVLSEF